MGVALERRGEDLSQQDVRTWRGEKLTLDDLQVEGVRVIGDVILSPPQGAAGPMRLRCRELQFFDGGQLVLKGDLVLYAERLVGAARFLTGAKAKLPTASSGVDGKPGKPGDVGKPGKHGKAATLTHHANAGEIGGRGGDGSPGDGGTGGKAGVGGLNAFSLRAYFGGFELGASILVDAKGQKGADGGSGGNGGPGGDGGRGGQGGDGGRPYTVAGQLVHSRGKGGKGGHGGNGNSGGAAGRGGDGGPGGNGGRIALAWPSRHEPESCTVLVEPGAGGAPGALSKAGGGGAPGEGGPPGRGNGSLGVGERGGKGPDGAADPGGCHGDEGQRGTLWAEIVPSDKAEEWCKAALP